MCGEDLELGITHRDEQHEPRTRKGFNRHHQEPLICLVNPTKTKILSKTQVILMDLSLATTSSDQEQDRDQEIADADNNMNLLAPVEKEHMFDKVVTPSDVGKLNRLVIPKQHAEKYFPLDSSSSQNGTLLNFQDRNGKMWRFRYSYWNSSQSYVMTKGWSRFVKEKKLDAGDIVSFQRGVGTESAKLRLFIDWRHRPDINLVQNPTIPTSSLFRHHNHHHSQLGTFNFNFNFPTSVHGNRLPEYSVPRSLNFGVRSNMYHQQQHQYYRQEREIVGYGYGSFVGRCWPLDQRNSYGSDSLVIDSVPVVPGRMTPGVMVPPPPPPEVTAVGKRLRLFGVNMECGTDDYNSSSCSGRDIVDESGVGEGGVPRGEMGASSSSSSSLRLSFPSDDDQNAKKGKSLSSFSLDLNP